MAKISVLVAFHYCSFQNTSLTTAREMMFKSTFRYIPEIFVVFIFTLSATYAGDLCPGEEELAPCTCTHVHIDNAEPKHNIPTITQMPKFLRTKIIDNDTEVAILDRNNDVAPERFVLKGYNSSYYTVVACRIPKSLEVLEEVVSNGLHRKWVDKLIVTNIPAKKEHTLVHLPSGWLKNLRVKQFEIRDTLLAGDFIFNGNPFEGQDQSLVWFTVNNCYLSGSLTYDTIGTVNTKGLNNLPRIEGVDFTKNLLTHILAASFRYPSANLTSVNLSYNSIGFIENTAFAYIPKLKHVDLSHNLLQSINRAIFAKVAPLLEHIDMSWNQLKSLPADFFTGMPSLKIINLRSNFLYSMPEKPWAAIWKQLKFIDVTGNFVECNCDLLWLVRMISVPEGTNSTTVAPNAANNQTVLGTCAFTQPQIYTKQHQLTNLTYSSLNC